MKEKHQRPRKPDSELRQPAPFRIRADLIERIEQEAARYSLPASLVAEILIARALESQVLDSVLTAAQVKA